MCAQSPSPVTSILSRRRPSPALISQSVVLFSLLLHTSPHHTTPHDTSPSSVCGANISNRVGKKTQHTHVVLETSNERGIAPTTLICNAHCRLMHCQTNSKQSSRSCNDPHRLPHCAAPFIPDNYAHKAVERAKNLRKRPTWHQDSSSTGIPPRP